ncbi:S66 peptidase family protein [Pedobacter steynii]|uniref:LD-carboxypeptidase n=1 Tax=Pedobacter steynii TaxID=430522 RepID=A0A1D7QMI7_9SPHI|nr:LD-carboxypeptidase [Pedobacter steynii]AOM79874.1 LD-carboxypeptidase [Pedobacter steynii]
MNRKHFLSFMAMMGLTLPALKSFGNLSGAEPESGLKIPDYLKAGDTIGITCPAGFITMAEILPSIQLMESWGFKVKVGKTVDRRDFTFGGSDQERLLDLQNMLDDPELKAIMCARGGYGAVRIIDQLNFDRFIASPKWVIGFSDVTVLHCHLSRKYGIASIHSKMCNSFPADWTLADPVQIETILSIRQALSGEQLRYSAPPLSYNRAGKVEGILIGGNLSIIETLAGSKSDLKTEGKILFLEDTGEYLYRIDRMFWNLKRTGKLDQLQGLIIGGFKVKPDDPGEEFGKTVYEIVQEKVREYNYPVCFDFPVGHQRNNFALKCGVRHTFEVNSSGSSLTSLY